MEVIVMKTYCRAARVQISHSAFMARSVLVLKFQVTSLFQPLGLVCIKFYLHNDVLK